MTLRGSTKEFPLDVVIKILAETKKTGELALRGATSEGALGLADGRVVTAVYGAEKPIPALGAIFGMGEADFEFTAWSDAPPANLEGELADNLKKAEEYAAWLADVRQVVPNDRVRFRLSERAAEQGAVTFTPDRWRVVLAVNGERDVNGIAEHLRIDRDDALTLLAGLVRDAVIDTIEPAESAPSAATPSAAGAPPAAEPPAQSAMAAPAPEPAPVVEPEPPRPTLEWSEAELARSPEAEPEPPPPPVAEPPVDAWAAPPPIETPPPPPPPVTEWTAPADAWAAPPEPAPSADTWTAPAEAAPSDVWASPPPFSEPTPEPPPPAPLLGPNDPWAAAPSPEPPRQDWAAPVESAPPSAMDDRLSALFGGAPTTPTPEPPPAADQWSTPVADWTTPAPATEQWSAPAAEPAAPAADDPRLHALSLPPLAPEAEPGAAEPAAPPANEWAPPTMEIPVAAPPQPKKGLFGGLFRKSDRSAATPSAPEASGASRVGRLAALSNALLTEYNSGAYGKNRVDDRIPNLLMRVDEQADPIDRPLPVIDDRLDVQALERVTLPEQQAVPYLATLVATIYGDAEKAFGRDKAKRGYKAALMQTFGGDASVLSSPDLAGKLPKI